MHSLGGAEGDTHSSGEGRRVQVKLSQASRVGKVRIHNSRDNMLTTQKITTTTTVKHSVMETAMTPTKPEMQNAKINSVWASANGCNRSSRLAPLW